MDYEIIFEDCNIIFTRDDFKNVDRDTLEKCQKRLQNTLLKLNDQK